MSELTSRAVELVKKIAELEDARMEISYEAIGGHCMATVVKPDPGEIGYGKRRKQQEPGGLFIRDRELLRFSKHADYRMRQITRNVNALIDEIDKELGKNAP